MRSIPRDFTKAIYPSDFRQHENRYVFAFIVRRGSFLFACVFAGFAIPPSANGVGFDAIFFPRRLAVISESACAESAVGHCHAALKAKGSLFIMDLSGKVHEEKHKNTRRITWTIRRSATECSELSGTLSSIEMSVSKC